MFDEFWCVFMPHSILELRSHTSQAVRNAVLLFDPEFMISRTQTEFCLKFRSMATGVNQKKCSLQHSVAHPRNSPTYRRKNLADIFYTSRVIANLVPNFVGMALGVGQGKRQLAAFDGPSPNPPPIGLGAKISQKSLTQAALQPTLFQISLPWQPGRVRGKIK